jgi:hypothetical protein
VAGKALGGGSSAVAASAHAACARFRGTDPLITGVTRRALATQVGYPDSSGSIPEARWMRAMTFERLVRDVKFASEVATTTVGRLGLERPSEVVTVNASVNVDKTAQLLVDAHDRALATGSATLIHGLAVPFVGFEETKATDVKPDFAVVAPKVDQEGNGSWLVVGDAKDYERVRSRIEDTRLLKGFLQVALGAESCAHWSQLPPGMAVHDYGVLAVPRNAFLQPEALVELLDDHRREVRMRVGERRREAGLAPYDEADDLPMFVAHLRATFDPASCTTCPLFSYCRDELRRSTDPTDLLIELGVARDVRPHVIGLVDASGVLGSAPASVVANVVASLDGVGRPTGQLRTDQAGQPGTINVVIAKSDAAALGVHGMATQRVTATGREEWELTVFDEPQSADTRRAVMKLLGQQLTKAITAQRKANPDAPSPVHLVVPDKPTADVLVSIADNLAGIELSRLRWERDRKLGREPLTFNGEPAAIPPKLPESDRTAVSFLLEEDRARALTLRSPIVDLRTALACHVVAGGPAINSYRLDYLVEWAHATKTKPLQHRDIADRIEGSDHTPGARLTNRRSDAIHQALTGSRSRRRESRDRPADPEAYDALVREELAFKCDTVERALDALDTFTDSTLREVHRAIEGDAQAVWRGRLSLHASDLVRFGRTYRFWRNRLVPVIESDGKCHGQLLALANRQAADDLATSAGMREVAVAIVVSAQPLILDVSSRRLTDGSRIVLLHVGDQVCVEGEDVEIKAQQGSFRLAGLSIGPLLRIDDPDHPRRFFWTPATIPSLDEGERLDVADFTWFSKNTGNTFLNVSRPGADDQAAPKPTCNSHSYDDDPDAHQFCCRPHEVAEAEWSDELAARRARGELNPQVWPPVVDGDAFEVGAVGDAVGDPTSEPASPAPDDLTMDDLE